MVKLIPLALVAVLGFIYGDPGQITSSGFHSAILGENASFLVLFTASFLITNDAGVLYLGIGAFTMVIGLIIRKVS